MTQTGTDLRGKGSSKFWESRVDASDERSSSAGNRAGKAVERKDTALVTTALALGVRHGTRAIRI